ncbi:MAG: SIS domain-containing protein [Chloroflexi bacterium]|nr:MAG: SIS domain-containing protein [Chloroflexota bacterium]MBL1192787.1 SIS domain-containing protein [Chloroflexota bacterium]NOH10081.1 SIS domain-containing protein [Chloroflexota bacterium]
MEPMKPDVLVKQVESLPELIREETRRFFAVVQDAFDVGELSKVNRVFITGDGDSYHAAEAVALAFEEIAGVPCEAISAQRFLDYSAEFMPIYSSSSTLAIAVSASGRTERGVQALERANEPGAMTVALTGQAGSPFTETAKKSIVVDIPDFGPSPGIRTYNANLIGLLLLAIHIGVSKNRLSADETEALLAELESLDTVMQATLEASKELAKQTVAAWQDADRMMFVGSGPSYGTALFAAAKVVEAAGVFAVGQDLEEWSHVERFSHPHDLHDMPMVIFAPPGRSHWRAILLAELGKSLGRRVAVVIKEGDDEMAEHADIVFPVKGEMREAFSPLVYHIMANYFASYLTEALGRMCFRSDQRAG